MPRDLDPTLLRTFVVAAERTSMTAAGNALHMTQGAVRQQIDRLEWALDCVLFIRSRRGLRLAPHGERLIGRWRGRSSAAASSPARHASSSTWRLRFPGEPRPAGWPSLRRRSPSSSPRRPLSCARRSRRRP
ncbi:LysR family transcriptional regulator [Streptomyces sp. DASNCL29]|nr:LysR family transcriptional regulator [Streptomyces sp. DASNCL29]